MTTTLPLTGHEVLDPARTTALRAVGRRAAGFGTTADDLRTPTPVVLFVATHHAVRTLVAETFPALTSLVHLSQDVRVARPVAPDATLAVRPQVVAARPAPGGTDATVRCTVADADGDVAVLTAQVRLGGVEPPPGLPAVATDRPTAPTERADQFVHLGPVRHEAADVAEYALLSGDDNPIHLDDDVARAAGFARAIVHGMASVNAALEVALRTVGAAAGDVRGLSVRFSAPTPVGETQTCEIACAPSGRVVTFRVAGPGGVSVKNGRLELGTGDAS